jgi:hypothetical protein
LADSAPNVTEEWGQVNSIPLSSIPLSEFRPALEIPISGSTRQATEKQQRAATLPSPGGKGQVEGERHFPKQNIQTVLATENAENTKIF